MVVGTASGKCLFLNLTLTNFELEYLFDVAEGVEVSAVAVNGDNRIITSTENAVKFWQFTAGETLKTRIFRVQEEFEVDGPAVQLRVKQQTLN